MTVRRLWEKGWWEPYMLLSFKKRWKYHLYVCGHMHIHILILFSLTDFPWVILPSASFFCLFSSLLYFSAEFFSFKRQNLPPAIVLNSIGSFSYLQAEISAFMLFCIFSSFQKVWGNQNNLYLKTSGVVFTNKWMRVVWKRSKGFQSGFIETLFSRKFSLPL